MTIPVLHDYWRSGAAYRVRIALNLKGVVYSRVAHDLRTGEQRTSDYLRIAPQGLVPALETSSGILIQSPAILEWLEESYPLPKLMPPDASGRAHVRAMAAVIGCDIHPVNNLRILDSLRRDLGADQAVVREWIERWIVAGFDALEVMVGQHGGGFCYGDAPTLADCYLVPQIYSAKRFDVDLKRFPRLVAAAARADAVPEIAAAHPNMQPDAD